MKLNKTPITFINVRKIGIAHVQPKNNPSIDITSHQFCVSFQNTLTNVGIHQNDVTIIINPIAMGPRINGTISFIDSGTKSHVEPTKLMTDFINIRCQT